MIVLPSFIYSGKACLFRCIITDTAEKGKPYLQGLLHFFTMAGFEKTDALWAKRLYLVIFTATSRPIFIMLVKVVWRSSAVSSVPSTRLSLMEQMASARLPR